MKTLWQLALGFAAVGILAVGLVFVTTGTAHGIPNEGSVTPGCVDVPEYQSAQGLVTATGGSRFDVETRWEVTGKGVVTIPTFGDAVRYRRCGYALAESFIGVRYSSPIYADATMTAVGIFTS